MTEPAPATVRRITIAFTAKSNDALTAIQAHDDLNPTDTVNRALNAYKWMLDQQADGSELLLRTSGGEMRKVELP